jgi:hypothetical protein
MGASKSGNSPKSIFPICTDISYLRAKIRILSRMINTPYKQLESEDTKIRPGLQFLIFIGVFAGIFFVGNLIGAGIVIALYGMKTFMALASLNMALHCLF